MGSTAAIGPVLFARFVGHDEIVRLLGNVHVGLRPEPFADRPASQETRESPRSPGSCAMEFPSMHRVFDSGVAGRLAMAVVPHVAFPTSLHKVGTPN